MGVLLPPPLIQTIIQQFQEEKQTVFERFLLLPTKLTSVLASHAFLATMSEGDVPVG